MSAQESPSCGWMAMAEWEPWAVIYAALGLRAGGGEPSEDLTDAVRMAAAIIVSATLMDQGSDEDSVIRQFNERGWSLRIAYDGETSTTSMEIHWLDDNEVAIFQSAPC